MHTVREGDWPEWIRYCFPRPPFGNFLESFQFISRLKFVFRLRPPTAIFFNVTIWDARTHTCNLTFSFSPGRFCNSWHREQYSSRAVWSKMAMARVSAAAGVFTFASVANQAADGHIMQTAPVSRQYSRGPAFKEMSVVNGTCFLRPLLRHYRTRCLSLLQLCRLCCM